MQNKTCEIPECGHDILNGRNRDPQREREAGKLCAPHFFALASIEYHPAQLDMPEGQRRQYFLNAVRLIAQAQRIELLAWREKNPRAMEAGQ